MHRNSQSNDYGPEPFVTNIRQAAETNRNFREALWTGEFLQLTLMCIPVRGEIGLEAHPCTDQFLHIERGCGVVMMGPRRGMLNSRSQIRDGCAVFVPAGTWHNIVNTGGCPLRLYSIYAPPQHPRGVLHQTKAQADEEEG